MGNDRVGEPQELAEDVDVPRPPDLLSGQDEAGNAYNGQQI
jgi:hypothetical protein